MIETNESLKIPSTIRQTPSRIDSSSSPCSKPLQQLVLAGQQCLGALSIQAVVGCGGHSRRRYHPRPIPTSRPVCSTGCRKVAIWRNPTIRFIAFRS